MTDHTLSYAPTVSGVRNRATSAIVALAAAAFLYFLPDMISGYWLRTFISATALVLASLSVSLLYAQVGMISLAQYALLGVGGWFALRIAHGTDLPFEVALLGGGVAAALFGLVTGLPALRMRGLYLAIITLMTAGAIQVFISAFSFPDGRGGILGNGAGARSMMERPLLATTDAAYFRYAVVVVAICFLLVWINVQGRPGRAWAMIRRGEICALAGGVNIVAYKVWAFTLAGFLAGISGGLLAGGVGQLDGSAFPASQSILLFAITVIAGAYSWIGPIIAGLMLRAFPALLNDFHLDGNIANIVFGAGLLHALITAPNGIAGQVTDLAKGIAKRLRRGPGKAAS